MSNFDSLTTLDRLSPENTIGDVLDEARLLAQVLQDSLHDDMARSYQCMVIIARITEAMTRLRQPAEA